MAVVLDAAAHPPKERSDLVREVIADSGVRRRVALNMPAESVDLQAEAWQIGSTQVLRTHGTGLTLRRTERDILRDESELVAIVLSRGECRYSACGTTQRLAPQGVLIVDFGTPYAFAHAGPSGTSFVTHIRYADLGLPVDAVRTAIPQLASSPLLPLVRGHLRQVSAQMDEIASQSAVAASVAGATIDLTRALVMSAAAIVQDQGLPRDALRTQIVAYIRAHLRERDLTPTRIAAEHYISLRTLYNVWGDQDGTLSDWIVRQRLEGARRELAVSAPGSGVFAVAGRWGFADPAHFSRRFRALYGLSPAAWLREARPSTP